MYATQVERYVIKLTKVLLSLLENHPLSFVDCLPATLNLTVHYAFTPDGEPLLFERFLIQCLNLLKGILMCPEYKPAKIVEGKLSRVSVFISFSKYSRTPIIGTLVIQSANYLNGFEKYMFCFKY